MQHLEGSGTPVLYILDARFLKVKSRKTASVPNRRYFILTTNGPKPAVGTHRFPLPAVNTNPFPYL
jgi:hypothetical protein